jgi:flavin reductase (DIM6/NTAB) family NADH-FMN oxidoreductase RutF/rubredoxin
MEERNVLMGKNALQQLTYGIFLLSAKSNEKKNACIINTCFQAASNPTRIAISVMNRNLTCEMIRNSRYFTRSVLDDSCTLETIRHFGYQSGKTTDKFEKIRFSEDENGVPYLDWQICAVLSCRVVESVDLGSHTLFIAEVLHSKGIGENQPLTYFEYQNRVKAASSKTSEKKEVEKPKKIIGWKCKVCQYVYEGEKLPESYLCPLCGHGPEDFEPIYQ